MRAQRTVALRLAGIHFRSGLPSGSYFRPREASGVPARVLQRNWPQVRDHDHAPLPKSYFCPGGHGFGPAAAASFSFHGEEIWGCGG